MPEQAESNSKPFDTMDPWRGMRNAYLEAWAKTMVEMVNSEAYAQATGAMLDSYLTVSAPFREVIEKTMVKALEQLAMPSRADVLSIAERMTNIEMRLDDLDAKLDQMNPKPTGSRAAGNGADDSSPAGAKRSKQTRQNRSK